MKVVRHYALFSTDIFEIKNDEIKDVYVIQITMGKKFDFGNIIITSPTKKLFLTASA